MKPLWLEQPLLPDRFSENPLLESAEGFQTSETITKSVRKRKCPRFSDYGETPDEEREPSDSPVIIEDSPDLSRAQNISAKKYSENPIKNPFEDIGIRTEVSRIVDANQTDNALMTRMNRLQSSFKFDSDRVEWRYNPFKTPPDLQLLETHKNAKKVGYFDIYDPKTFFNTCPCCHLPTKKEPLAISCPSRKLAFLGTGR